MQGPAKAQTWFPDYRIEEWLYESERSLVLRGREAHSGRRVVLKQLKSTAATPRALGRLRMEYELLKRLASTSVVGVERLVSHDGRHALVLESIEAPSLAQQLEARTLQPPRDRASFVRLLRIAIALADAVERIHQREVIHKDIEPANILWSDDARALRIVDLDSATLVATEPPDLLNPNLANLADFSLTYVSPEQTGRMNRPIDRRSDLYSVGVTLYHLLTGQPPFTGPDPADLLHCHLAQLPAPLRERNPATPQVLSDIVMKLLAKSPDDRYQSAHGLKHDLGACLRAVETSGEQVGFPLARADVSSVFQIGSRLYGRAEPIATLLGCFDAMMANGGTSALALVHGYSGIGKSAVVNEIHRPLSGKRGLYIAGKFDQFKRNVPYAPVAQAFGGLMRYLLTESDAALAGWRARILAAVKSNGGVLTEVIPELERVIGAQPAPAAVGVLENQNRFRQTFLDFLAVFCRPEHPLVIFFDDLQWADTATLALIEAMATADGLRHLFVIGAYRDNEVDAQHPLRAALRRIAEVRPYRAVELGPLAFRDVNHMVADCLLCPVEEAVPLTRHVYDKTQGNPFFVKLFLDTIHRDGHIRFDLVRCGWAFDLAKIRAMEVTENVVDLVLARFRRFYPETRQALSVAAFLGNRFELRLTAIAAGRTLGELGNALWPAVVQGFIVPLDDDYRWMNAEEGAPGARFRFIHDRAQQAAYALVPAEERSALHLALGRLLRAQLGAEELKERLFEVVDHLDRGAALLTDADERRELAEVNLAVARRAKASSAYQPARAYVEAGLALLPPEPWQTCYPLKFALELEKGELEYLLSHWTEAMTILCGMLAHVTSKLDRMRVQHIRAICYQVNQELSASLDVCREALADLGLSLDPPADGAAVEQQIDACYREFIVGKDVEAYFDLPELDDPEALAILELLSTAMPAAYHLRSPLVMTIPIRMLEIAVRRGNCPLAPLGHIFLSGGTLGIARGDYATARRFGRLALRLFDEKYPVKAFEPILRHVWGGFVAHYTEDLATARAQVERAHVTGVEQGAYNWAGYAADHVAQLHFWGTSTLPETIEVLDRTIATLARVAPHAMQLLRLLRATAHNLVEEVPDHFDLANQHCPELAEMLRRCQENDDLNTQFIAGLCQLTLANWFGEPAAALAFGAVANRFEAGGRGPYSDPVYHLHHALAYAAGCAGASAETRAGYLAGLEAMLARLTHWAGTAPSTYEHQRLMVAAERARLRGEAEAAELYDRAISDARRHGFLANEALSNELAARFHFGLDRPIGRAHLTEACAAYRRWGASAKVAQLASLLAEPKRPALNGLR